MKKTLHISLTLLASLLPLLSADFEIHKKLEFPKIVAPTASLKKLAGGMQFIEGPVWISKDSGYLVFSDIPANELKVWREKGGVTTYRTKANNPNGNTLNLLGNLLTCEHSGRRIAIEEGGVIKTLVDKYNGKKFNSPNDVVVKSDGTVWFTDPDYGLGQNPKEQEGNFVYRFDPQTGKVTAVVKDFDKPNGLCFSPDEKKLYIADSGKPRHIRVFDVEKVGALANGEVFCEIDKGGPDGIRCDGGGRVWSSAGDGVHIYAPDGTLIAKILTPETPANLCFGGRDRKTLFITARTSLYAIDLKVKGAR